MSQEEMTSNWVKGVTLAESIGPITHRLIISRNEQGISCLSIGLRAYTTPHGPYVFGFWHTDFGGGEDNPGGGVSFVRPTVIGFDI